MGENEQKMSENVSKERKKACRNACKERIWKQVKRLRRRIPGTGPSSAIMCSASATAFLGSQFPLRSSGSVVGVGGQVPAKGGTRKKFGEILTVKIKNALF